MNNKSLVSVALTTFNGERYLKEQLDSIYGQTYKNLEVVVCDDGSEQNTLDILKGYQNKYGLKLYRNEKRLGFLKNFERVLGYCKGEFIATADQDDIWVDDKIEIFIRSIENNSLICSDMTLIDQKGKIIHDSYLDYIFMKIPKDGEYRTLLNFRNFALGCASMFRKDLLEKALPIPEYAKYHDWWLAKTAVREKGLKFISEKLTLYRRHEGNTSRFIKRESFIPKTISLLTEKGRKPWIAKRHCEIRDSLEKALNGRLEIDPCEKRVIEESIQYVNYFIEKKISFMFFLYGLKNRKYLYERAIHLPVEFAIYIYIVLAGLLKAAR